MTLVNFILAEEAVFLVADTQVSDPQDMQPITFTNKVYLLPHIHGLMFGTGIASFILEWQNKLLANALVRNIKQLNEYTTNELQNLYLNYEKIFSETDRTPSSTVYHLGYNEDENRFIGYAYRSTNEFASEKLEYGCFFKPALEIDQIPTVEKFPVDYIPVAELQKDLDTLKPLENQVGIGGHLIAYHMCTLLDDSKNTTIQTNVRKFYEFKDIESAYSAALKKLVADNI